MKELREFLQIGRPAVFVFALLILSLLGIAKAEAVQELDRLVLTVDPVQYVGHPFRSTSEVLFFDNANNPLPTYNLVDSPLVLIPDRGSLVPDTLADNAYFSSGSVDLTTVPVVYRGPTGSVSLQAQSADITSSSLLVSLNGYDVVSASFADGSPITQLFAGIPTSIAVRVQNNGSISPNGNAFIRTFFASGGGSVKVFFDGKADGVTDTLLVLLPDIPLATADDTLIIEAAADFLVDTVVLRTIDTLRIPVRIDPTPQITVIEGSVTPDSIYGGVRFDLGFLAETLTTPDLTDSTRVAVRLVSEPTGQVSSTLYDAQADFTVIDPQTLQYSGLSVPAEATLLDTGLYRVEMDFTVYSSSPTVVIKNIVADSMWILEPPELTIDDATLTPLQVIGGARVTFSFDVTLAGDEDVSLIGSRTTLSLIDQGFSTTVSLRAPGGILSPGLNTLQADSVDIPVDIAPDSLTAEALVTYRQMGVGNSAQVESSFGGQTIEVLTPIAIQLVSTDLALLPNPPFVNTGQRLQITGTIDNPSDRDATDVAVTIQPSGLSTPDLNLITVDRIFAASDTTVEFWVTAASETTPGETFTLTVAATGAEVLPPIDNSAAVTIQSPAQLLLACDTVSGLDEGYVRVGESFQLEYSLTNSGEAGVDPVGFIITSNGVDFGVPDPLTGELAVGTPRRVTFTAPQQDTVATLAFSFIEAPTDINTGLPATINRINCATDILVTSLTADLIADGEVVDGNLVESGQLRTIFNLSVNNRGQSARSPVQIERVRFTFSLAQGANASISDIFEIGSTGMFVGDQQVASATGAQNELFLHFTAFILGTGESSTLALRSRLKRDAPEDFRINLVAGDIRAIYTEGPLAGEPAGTETSSGDSVIVADAISVVAGGRLTLTIRDNPFSPLLAPAEFSYLLPSESAVDFRILTLTGEQVFDRSLAAGDPGTSTGGHVLEWDGRNGRGDLVLNGVYVVILRALDIGQRETFKVAVIK